MHDSGFLPRNARCLPPRAARVLEETDSFINQWMAHGVPLTAGRDLRHNQFVLVGVDERAAGVSGCSVDALVRRMQQLEGVLGLELVNNAPVLYREGRRHRSVSRATGSPSSPPRAPSGRIPASSTTR